MFALNGVEIAILGLTVAAVIVAYVAIRRGGDMRLGIAAILAAVLLPVLGPLLALTYGALSMTRAQRRDSARRGRGTAR